MTCERCGLCCMLNGSFDGSDNDTGPCNSLSMKDGIATCLLQDEKPDVCLDYPDGEKCFREQGMTQSKTHVPGSRSYAQQTG